MGNCTSGGGSRGGGKSPINGLSDRLWQQLSQAAKAGNMPVALVGNTDTQVAMLKGINALYPEVSDSDMKKYNVQYIEPWKNQPARFMATVGSSTKGQFIPAGAENDMSVINGALKMFIANIKKKSR